MQAKWIKKFIPVKNYSDNLIHVYIWKARKEKEDASAASFSFLAFTIS